MPPLAVSIARANNEANITQHGMLVGTVLYMSPEQVRGDELDARSDVFALGSVLYHAMTGQLPFPGKSFPEVCMSIRDGNPKRPSTVRIGFPHVLDDFVMKCLAASPADRYADASASHGALLAIADSASARNGAVTNNNLSGSILIPPLACGGSNPASCSVMAGSLRKDLRDGILRIKDLKATLLENGSLPSDVQFDYVLRCELQVADARGTLEVVLERYEDGQAPGRPPHLVDAWRDRVEYSDKNEFGLQEGLVRTALRAVKKRISEAALLPVKTAQRNVEEGRVHAKRAHEILHRGTTKHLLASISSFRRAIDADPFCAIAYAGLGEAMVRKYLYWDGDTKFLDEAREEAARALAIDPNCAEAHTSLGFAWHLSGHSTDAQREYRLAMQIDNGEWLAHRLLGALLARGGNFKNASPLLHRAIALKPTHIGSYDHLYGVLQRLNRYEEAIETADQGIAAARQHLPAVPNNMAASLHMAMLLARMGRTDDARAEAARARELAPKDGYTAFHAGCVYALTAELAEAIECLATAQSRGYFIQSELARNTDFDVLRGLPEFQALVA
jgi:tetratricopeptide (TPR) repeat protein